MMNDINTSKIESMIYIIKGQKVMLDSDLAALYEVETKNLNKAVKRNSARFPPDFMFQLNSEDLATLRFQFGTANAGHKKRYLPYVFTENGIAMLSSVLNSERAISVNISIMRTFTKMRSLILNDQILSTRLHELEKDTNKVFRIIFERLDTVEDEISDLRKESPALQPKRKKIGLK